MNFYRLSGAAILAALLLAGACCSVPAGPDLSVDLTESADAAGCVSCRQSDRNACGGVPSWCACRTPTSCCCKKVGP